MVQVVVLVRQLYKLLKYFGTDVTAVCGTKKH